MSRPFLIAEVSSNHHRDLARCFAFIDRAAALGCDAVKFQLFRIDALFAPEILARSEEHRRRRRWELSVDFLPSLVAHCEKRRIQFACTPFYLEAVELLLPHVSFFKIASYELLWHDLLRKVAVKPVVLSTGMADLKEVGAAVAVLREARCPRITLLHCSSAYPTPLAEANLAAIATLREAFGCEVGWSDHTREPAVLLRAAWRWGASAIEFHLDLDGRGDEFSAGHCWLPEEIEGVIELLGRGPAADGDGVKQPMDKERADRDWRADPEDGLRPLRRIRGGLSP